MRARHEATIDRTNMYSRGLAPEGWNAGYIQALSDVSMLLNGADPALYADEKTASLWTAP